MPEAVAFFAGLSVSLVATKPVMEILRDRGVVDAPNARSSHTDVTPRGGGLAVMLALALALGLADAPTTLWGVFICVVLGALVGSVDDIRGLSAIVRLTLQLLLSVALSAWMLRDADLTPLLGLALGALCVVWLTGYVNAYNFMDGINGISAVAAASAGAWYLWLGVSNGIPELSIGGAALSGAALGFLPWNAPHARVFLGDVGSYGLGLLLGSLAALAVVRGIHPLLAGAPLFVYVADTAWTLALRVHRRDSWREAHREHVYQRLCDRGWSHTQVTGLVLILIAATCAVAWWAPPLLSAALCLAAVALYLAAPRLLAMAR